MFLNLKLSKKVIALTACSVIIFIAVYTLQNKAAQEGKQTQQTSLKIATPSNSKPIAIPNSRYAQPLTPEQVKAINDAKLPLEASMKPLPMPELPPPLAVVSSNNSNRCFYNKQTYALGDIVKMDKGWIRCSPTITFNPDKPVLPQSGSSAWTTVQ